jgi:tetratricopeptide (TPR) repeat protein
MWGQGDYRRGKEMAEAAIALLDQLGTETLDAIAARNALAASEHHLGNVRRAAEIFESAAALARVTGNDLALAMALSGLGNQALEAGDLFRARTHLEEVAAIGRRLRQEPLLANALVDLGFVALTETGAVEEAAAKFHESLSICRAERVTHTLVWAVEGLAAIALARDAPAVATRLLAATGSLRTEIGFAEGYYAIGDEVRERTLEGARELLGEDAFATAWADGENSSVEELGDEAALVD